MKKQNDGKDLVYLTLTKTLDQSANVAAVMRGAGYSASLGRLGGRFASEIHKWMQTYKLHLIPPTKEVSIDTSNNDDLEIFKLAVLVTTDVTINIGVHQPRQALDQDIEVLRGIVQVCANAATPGASVSFNSFADIIRSKIQFTKMVVHCPVDTTGFNVVSVASVINNANYPTNAEIEFGLPVAIGVQSVGQVLVNNFPTWEERPRRHNGPIRKKSRSDSDMVLHYSTALSYDIQENRITITKTYRTELI